MVNLIFHVSHWQIISVTTRYSRAISNAEVNHWKATKDTLLSRQIRLMRQNGTLRYILSCENDRTAWK